MDRRKYFLPMYKVQNGCLNYRQQGGDPDIGEYSRLPGGSFRFLVGRSMKSPSPESAKPGNDVVRIACLWRDMNVMDLSSPFARSEQN